MRSFGQRLGLMAAGAVFSAAFFLSPTPAAAMDWPLGSAPQQGEIVQGTLAANPTIQFQGRLLDPATGQPKSDGAYAMTFRLYGQAVGSTALWTETKNVTLTRFEVTVDPPGGGKEMSPRVFLPLLSGK